jgi:hypothetical protein
MLHKDLPSYSSIDKYMWIFDKDISKKIEIRNKKSWCCPFEGSKTNVQKYRWTRKSVYFVELKYEKCDYKF